MPVEQELGNLSLDRDTLLTIGVFDGVHRGHQHLISQLMKQARQQNLLGGVVTFRQHPQEILSPRTRLPYLTSVDEKVRLLKNEGIDLVVVLSFTAELARLSMVEFVGLLKKYLRMRGLVVGPDFALGRNREGDIDTLRKLGKDMEFNVTVVPPLKRNGEVVSSTAIRQALAAGDVRRVSDLIGRPFRLQGRIVSGAGRGSKLVVPTANLEADPNQALPADGVYATRSDVDGKVYQSMTNIGHQPTFDGSGRTVETYILNYNGNLYGHELKIDFVERLRGEKRFDTTEELKRQIDEDIKKGVAILNSRSKNQI
ncbi:MAG: bifunctional riboflavin kinase/FAD synthetase [Chloroflexi bacterium]|nr:bifunctional riboflavin kinase/FAD synthetase [Chloroflexota bacterium]